MSRVKLALSCVAATLVAGCGGAGGHGAETCREIAVAYRTALDSARVCNPSAVDPCIAFGATVSVEVLPTGDQVVDGLCTQCPTGVNSASTTGLVKLLDEYKSLGCNGACYCPPERINGTWVPVCTTDANEQSACTG